MRYGYGACLGICLALLCGLSAVGHATAEDEQLQIAQRFITAYFRQDNATVRTCLPADITQMFMAYPFSTPPVLGVPKVHTNQAVVEFTGSLLDGKLPTHGGIVVYKSHDPRHPGWSVRQVLFYNKLPSYLGLPSHSVSNSDRAQEAQVSAISQAFLAAWRTHNMGAMQACWNNWAAKDEDPVKGLVMSHFHGVISRTAWGDPYVTYDMKASYHFGFLSYSKTIHGGVILVKTREGYRVRGNHFVLAF